MKLPHKLRHNHQARLRRLCSGGVSLLVENQIIGSQTPSVKTNQLRGTRCDYNGSYGAISYTS